MPFRKNNPVIGRDLYGDFKAAGETRSSVFVYLKRMHEVRRMKATLREIFMSEFCSIKSLVNASMVARVFNCVAGNRQEILCI